MTPFFMVISIVSASIFEILIFLRAVDNKKIAGIINDAQKIFVGLLTIFVPEIVYALVYLVSFNHLFATLTMGGISIVELWIALSILRGK